MSREWVFSIVFHVLILSVTFLGAPFKVQSPGDFAEVIRINAVSMADITPNIPEPEPITPIEVPRTLPAEEMEIPIEDPTSKPAAKIDKPPEKPKSKPKKITPSKTVSPTKATNNGGKGGETDIEAPAGTSISGVTIDNASFNYPYWFTMAWSKINQNFRVPVAIDGAVYCDIYFRVLKSGRIIELKVANSSGIVQFDEACVATITRSAPFPPLPREFVDEIIGITITFTN